MAGNVLKLVVGLQPVVARLGHPPGGTGILGEGLESLLLAVLGQVKPEFEDQRALIHQHRLKAVDIVENLVEVGPPQGPGDAIGDGLGVPGTGENAYLTLRRKRPPIAPHEGTLALFVTGCRESECRDVARIHPGIEQIDRFALAAAVYTAHQDDDRKFLLLQHVVLDVEERRPQPGHFLPESFPIDFVAQLCRFEHR